MVTCEQSLDLNNSGKAAKSLYAFGGDVLTNEVKIKYPNGIKKFGEFASITAVKSNLNCQEVYLTSIPATEKKSQTVSMHLYISNTCNCSFCFIELVSVRSKDRKKHKQNYKSCFTS